MQITEEEFQKLIHNYHYKDTKEFLSKKDVKIEREQGETTYEFNVDDSNEIHGLTSLKHDYGGTKSLSKPLEVNPLIIFGQDE